MKIVVASETSGDQFKFRFVLEEFQAREFPDHTGVTQRVIDDHFVELCSEQGTELRMSIFPGRGDPIPCLLRLRALRFELLTQK